MAPDTISRRTLRADELVLLEVGKADWGNPWVPDLAVPEHPIRITGSERIDILILGDGYSSLERFEESVRRWYEGLLAIRVYHELRGALRVRALFRKSVARASSDRGSCYRIPTDAEGNELDQEVEWWSEPEFLARLRDDVEEVGGVNGRAYPEGWCRRPSGELYGDLGALRSHAAVVFLVRTNLGEDPRGFVRPVPLGECSRINVAFGGDALRQIGKALAYLEDEGYSPETTSEHLVAPAEEGGVSSLSNLTAAVSISSVPWRHLSPWGRLRRQQQGDHPPPILGWLWRNEDDEYWGPWHSEYQCLMNRAGRRRQGEYCLWCQEIVALRLLDKTIFSGSLGPTLDRDREIYLDWVRRHREHYWRFFGVSAEILRRERYYAGEPFLAAESLRPVPLWRSGIYEIFRQDPHPTQCSTLSIQA